MKKNITLLLLLILVQVAGAQNILTLEECRQMAIESNNNLKSSVQRVLIAEDMLKAYRANHLPNISANASYLYSTASLSTSIEGGYLPIFTSGVYNAESVAYMPTQSYELEIGSVYNAGVMLTQPIYMGRRVTNAVKLAKIGVEVSTLSRRQSEAEVVEMADNAFFKVIELEEMQLSAQRYEGVVAEFMRQVESALHKGLKTQNDMLRVSVQLNEAKLLSLKVANGLRLAKMNLCYVVGLPLSTLDISLRDSSQTTYLVDEKNLDVTSRPEYTMLERQIEAKELEASITRAEFLPTISAIANYGYNNGVQLNGSTMLNGTTFSGGVMMNIPIFHWGEGRRKSSAKSREVTIAKNQMEDLSQQMTLELLHSINNYNESVMEVQLCQESLLQAEENMRQSQNLYNTGMQTLANHLESQALWQKAMSELCSAKSRQRTVYTQYLRCRGEL